MDRHTVIPGGTARCPAADDADAEGSDRRAIRAAVLRYCRGVDRLDSDLIRSAYHPGAIDHHTGFDGTIDDYVPWVTTALNRFSGTMHMLANHIVEIRGEEAVSEAYGQAVHWGDPPDDPMRNFTSGFRYVDHFRFIDGRWAIAERWAVREWTHGDAGRQQAREGAGPMGFRDARDPLAVLRRRVLEPRSVT